MPVFMPNLRKEENITIMRKNNIIKITAIALLSAFALTACDDDTIAKPKGYDDNSPVVSIDGFNGTIYNNTFTDIYDSIRAGNLASDVLDELLYRFSVSVFGDYNKVTAAKFSNSKEDVITLKQAVKSLDGDKKDADAFIKSHRAYWTKNKAGNRVDDAFVEVEDPDNAAPSASEYARLERRWKAIEKVIAEKMYAAISGGSYSERNVFEEERYLRNLALSIENRVNSVKKAQEDNLLFKGVLTSAVEDYDVFNVMSKDINGTPDYILHRENYQSNYRLDQEESKNQDATYVEDNLIPDIYRQLLVEQYILDKSYDTLGRTSARHVSVLSISKNSNYSKGAVNLMNTFVNDVIFDNDRTYDISLEDFKTVSNAWIGTFMDDANYNAADPDGKKTPWDLMSAAVPEYLQDSTDSASGKYFQGTAFGEMMEEMEKINENPVLSENESTYTGSNTYTVEVGKQIKKRELDLKDYTSTGWYVKSVGVSSLPDSLKNQLFDINVANALNPTFDKDGNQKDNFCVEYSYDATNGWTTNETEENRGTLINVVGKVKDQYFLRNTTRIKGNPVESDLLFESDGTYYVVLVEDAIRSKNLDKKNYIKGDKSDVEFAEELDKLETYISEIVQLVANNDTYKTLSKKHWLSEMNIKYHDTVVYDYFKSNFPELFED